MPKFRAEKVRAGDEYLIVDRVVAVKNSYGDIEFQSANGSGYYSHPEHIEKYLDTGETVAVIRLARGPKVKKKK